jgi:2-phospho-L-lactate guanylyltransferase
VFPLELQKPLFIIPIKELSETKTRLRASLPGNQTQMIDSLVEITFYNIIGIIKSLSLNYCVISPSLSIINHCKDLGATYTYRDLGTDLNRALAEGVQKLHLNQPVMIVMPDLPFITKDFLQSFLDTIKDEDIIIVPSISNDNDMGTAILYMKHPDLLAFQFGTKSSLLFQTEAQKKGFKHRVHTFDPYARDLDTLNDVKYLKQNIEDVYNSERYVKLLNQF